MRSPALAVGGENDDGRGRYICGLLAAVPDLFHRDVVLSGVDRQALYSGGVPGHLLARDE